MKKVYNILIVIIIIVIILILLLIGIKYGKNYTNEQEISNLVEKIEEQKAIIKKEENKETEGVDIEYKGYKVVGIINIPKINLEYPILEITTKETMKLSITKFWGNNVNEIGNLCLAGHNNHDGTMFGKTKKLKIGDIIELTDMQMVRKQYIIYNKYITDPNDISVTEAEENEEREVTLITCSNGNKERLIIKAREVK